MNRRSFPSGRCAFWRDTLRLIMDENTCRSCIDCGVTACSKGEGTYPAFCPTEHPDEPLLKEALDRYQEPENHAIMCNAADIEYEFYGRYTRVEETVEFAKRMGYQKIGIATCVGLITESRILARILRKNGFEVYGIGCKAGAVDKTEVGIRPECREVGPNMCNPIFQALTLNREGTQLNIIMGLCVGHDCLFTKYSEAPVTTLVAKDRVLAHNTVGALYNTCSYYKRLL